MKKQKISFQKLALKKDKVGALSATENVLGGATQQGCSPVTQAPDLCQKSFIYTGCPPPPTQTQNNCPSFPPQCTVNAPCNG